MSAATWARRGVAAAGPLLAGALGSVLTASPAMADTNDGSGIVPVDTHGIPITGYMLDFNHGAGVLGVAVSPAVTIPAGFAQLMFGLFIGLAWVSFSVLNLFLKLDWLGPLVGMAENISTALSNQLGASFVNYVIIATLLMTVVIFAMRNQAGRAWHHVAITLVCMGIGVMIVLPVGEAAQLLKMGRDIAEQTGSAITAQPSSTSPTSALVDEFVRRPTQRWQYGHDLDSLGCGQAWDDKIRAGDAEQVKDAALACPGGEALHAFAMNPGGAVWLGFLNPIYMLFVTALIGLVVFKLSSVAVGAVIHAGLIKPGLIGAGVPAGQSFLARNVIDGFVAAAVFCGYLLMLYVGASLTGIVAQSVPSSDAGMLVTILLMVAVIGGVRHAGKNMRGWKTRTARAVLPAGAPSAYRPPSTAPKHARQLAVESARQVAAKRRNTKLIKAVAGKGAAAAGADALAPEVAIPAQVLSSFAQHVVHAAAAAHHAQQGGAGGLGGKRYPAGGGYTTPARQSSSPSSSASVVSPARTVNYGGAVAARSLAKRSSQKRSQQRPAAAAGSRGAAAPGRPAPLRTSATRMPVSRTPVAVSGPRRPVGTSAPVNSGAPTTRSASNAPGRAGAPQTMRRSGAVSTARSAARDFRNRRR